LLQETFTIRRALELSLTQQDESSKEGAKNLLNTFEKFHASLKQLSDYLSPPYVEDSLPLAIQHLLGIWKLRYREVQIEMNLPENWHNDSHQHNRLVVMILDELLRIVLSNVSMDMSLAISLTAQATSSELKVQISQPNFSPTAVREFDYLSQSFRLLMSGQCFQRQAGKTVTWYFRWKPFNTHLL
jgi:hypothetical protein